ncbi:MAG: hypothetical protein HY537_03210 [Deltaproteobacteria bacterium]|nr:hypothetical protein [Deltaproteobacteria bacterium]
MKPTRIFSDTIILFFIGVAVAAFLVGCQKQSSDPLSQFRLQANKTLENLAHQLSDMKAGKAKGVRGLSYYQPSQSNQAYGGYYLRSLQQDLQSCAQLAVSFQDKAENYQPMVASLSACLARILAEQNPVYSTMYQNMDDLGRYYMGYTFSSHRYPGSIQNAPPELFSAGYNLFEKGFVDSDYSQ